ncbi:hypothetical protein LINPERHAP2_LOCUS30571 [Linum perenne]
MMICYGTMNIPFELDRSVYWRTGSSWVAVESRADLISHFVFRLKQYMEMLGDTDTKKVEIGWWLEVAKKSRVGEAEYEAIYLAKQERNITEFLELTVCQVPFEFDREGGGGVKDEVFGNLPMTDAQSLSTSYGGLLKRLFV